MWKAPVNGSGPKQLYLYCNTSSSHQLTGIYPTGTTCSNPSGAYYTSSYDAWGNVSSRSYSSTSATLSYDLLDHFTQWYVSSTNQEQYVYDASGERVLRRSTNSTSTTMTVYAFGLEEHQYSGSGTNQWNTYYYTLAGRLIGALDGNGTVFYFTDALGSVLSSFNNVAGGAAVKGNQVFGPYGKSRYAKGTINTAKGFTGQYNDSLTGLDYYGARYYDAVAGVFLSADTVQGNGSGENPYAYVGGNPETWSDPTGTIALPPAPPPAPAKQSDTVTIVEYVVCVDGICLSATVSDPGGLLGIGLLAADSQNNGIGIVSSSTSVSVTPHSSGIDVSLVPHTGGVDVSVTPHTPPPTQTGGGGLVPPNKPPVSTTPPPPERPERNDGLGKLSGRNIRPSECGITIVENHLLRPDLAEPDGSLGPENAAMIQRLRMALSEGETISGADASFYMHELAENTLMDRGMSYDEAHAAALAKYEVSPYSVYHPDVIRAFYYRFNSGWLNFWNTRGEGC